MKELQSLCHRKWACKYHVVFIPKRRKVMIFWVIRKHLGETLRELAEQKECQVVEGHLMLDNVHICISILSKHSVHQKSRKSRCSLSLAQVRYVSRRLQALHVEGLTKINPRFFRG